MRDARPGDDVAVGVGRDRLHRRRSDVDPDGDVRRHAREHGGRAGYASAASTASCSRPFVHTKLPAFTSVATVDRAPATAGLLDDRHERGDVPERSRSGRSRCRTRLRRRAGAARSRRCRGAASTGARGRASCRRCRRRRSARAVSHANESCASASAATDDTEIALAVAERAEPAAGPPARAERGRRRDADDELARVLEPDQRRPDRHAAHVALGAVDRVDDPAELGVGRRAPGSDAELLAEHGVTGRARRAARGSPARRPGRPRSPA